jgi:lysophospholipase L1-like esterase
VSFFSGQNVIQPEWPHRSTDLLPWFRTYHVGPSLAYNLIEKNTSSGGREKIEAILKEAVPPGSHLLLCFGEIDCRAHLVRRVREDATTSQDSVAICAQRYGEFISEIKATGFRPVVYNVIPSRSPYRRADQRGEGWVAIGSPRERNEVTHRFNQKLADHCRNLEIPFLETFDLLCRNQHQADSWYYFDNIHVAQRAMPLVQQALRQLLPELEIPHLPCPPPPTWWERFQERVQHRTIRLRKELTKPFRSQTISDRSH